VLRGVRTTIWTLDQESPTQRPGLLADTATPPALRWPLVLSCTLVENEGDPNLSLCGGLGVHCIEPPPRHPPATNPAVSRPAARSAQRRPGEHLPATSEGQRLTEQNVAHKVRPWCYPELNQPQVLTVRLSCDPLFSLLENAIAEEPWLSYPERWRCGVVTRYFNGGSDSLESSPSVTFPMPMRRHEERLPPVHSSQNRNHARPFAGRGQPPPVASRCSRLPRRLSAARGCRGLRGIDTRQGSRPQVLSC
jgi:hypothetical protein